MARFYGNENFPLPVVTELRNLGHDVLTIQETGKADQSIPDEDVLNFASQDNRAELTLNRKHFLRLHTKNSDHAGIIICSFNADFPQLAQRIHEAVTAIASLKGQLLRVNRPPF